MFHVEHMQALAPRLTPVRSETLRSTWLCGSMFHVEQ
jgi:hypothetical protein